MRLSLDNNIFAIELEGWEKFWTFHFKPIQIPLSSITEVSFGEPIISWKELRVPGTFFPGVIKAGTYIPMGSKKKSFWYFRYKNKVNTLTLSVSDFRWDTIIISHDEASYWADMISKYRF